MLSPTTTTTELSGLDDCFFRVIESTFEYSTNMANYLFQEVVVKSVAISNDTNNLASTKNWADHFTDAFEALGG